MQLCLQTLWPHPPMEGMQADGERLVAFLAGPKGQKILRGAGTRQASGPNGGQGDQREELLRRWQRAED
jgi:hypothetical protein